MNKPLYLKDIAPLFIAIQKAQIFDDQKTMCDAIPKFSTDEIMHAYHHEKLSPNFDLKHFISQYFTLPASQPKPLSEPDKKTNLLQHIDNLWDVLTRTAPRHQGTLLKLPAPYIVPGGRFTEFFYWDSYFIMLGLKSSGRIKMMRNLLDNCAYLIENYGLIPNGSRTIFLSRSQPPFFSCMVELYASTTEDSSVYKTYFEALEKEYLFWMQGADFIKNGESYQHLIKTRDGAFLNRYYDTENNPRPESYTIDEADKKKAMDNPEFYQSIRSACESGWDFSTRWFADNQNIKTIHILHLAQIDLNCLLWHLEDTLGRASKIIESKEKEAFYHQRAQLRKAAIQRYFWDAEESSYADYNFSADSFASSQHLGILYPLFFKIADEAQAKHIARKIEQQFLFPGGLITTTIHSGQQWDAPNAWAPLQWIAFVGLKNYGYHSLADKIREAWCHNVERVYQNTGKLMEKYDAIHLSKIAGGGEYPNQDGFGWTNGVYAMFKSTN